MMDEKEVAKVASLIFKGCENEMVEHADWLARAILRSLPSYADGWKAAKEAAVAAAEGALVAIRAIEPKKGETSEEECRAPVQGEVCLLPSFPRRSSLPAGTVAWSEHMKAWATYNDWFHSGQSAERMAERGGFGFIELCAFLGRPPETWKPASDVARKDRP